MLRPRAHHRSGPCGLWAAARHCTAPGRAGGPAGCGCAPVPASFRSQTRTCKCRAGSPPARWQAPADRAAHTSSSSPAVAAARPSYEQPLAGRLTWPELHPRTACCESATQQSTLSPLSCASAMVARPFLRSSSITQLPAAASRCAPPGSSCSACTGASCGAACQAAQLSATRWLTPQGEAGLWVHSWGGSSAADLPQWTHDWAGIAPGSAAGLPQHWPACARQPLSRRECSPVRLLARHALETHMQMRALAGPAWTRDPHADGGRWLAGQSDRGPALGCRT